MNILIDGQTLATAEINRGIGTYYKNIIQNVLENDFINDFYIITHDESLLKSFSPWTAHKLLPIINEKYNPQLICIDNFSTLNDTFSKTLTKDINQFNIDIYWTPNPLMDNVFLPIKNSDCIYSCTNHDLIPLVLKDIYFKLWPKKIVDLYYTKLEILKKDYDLFLNVSKNSQNDIIEKLSLSHKSHIVTFEGVNKSFYPLSFPKISKKQRYILYVGGFDPRKNMNKSIEAFSVLIKKYSYDKDISNLKLYIVCSYNEEVKVKLLDTAKSFGVEDRIVLTGFVDDKELIRLYQHADCFFFPTLYEGFGLPILEAFASGIPVACSDNSALPEVGGDLAHYFDVNDISTIASTLFEAMKTSNDFSLRQKRYDYTKQFSWKNAATKILNAFKNISNKNINIDTSIKKEKIAWLSPFSPQKSGISIYSETLIDQLSQHFDIHLYYDLNEISETLKLKFVCKPIAQFEDNYKNYYKVIYHLGNNSLFHTTIYKLAWDYPGIIVLHDYYITPFMKHSFLLTKEKQYFKSALIEGYSEQGKDEWEKIKNNIPSIIDNLPMSEAICKRSERVIVHHRWIKKQFKDSQNINVIPMYSFNNYEPNENDIMNYKMKYNLNKDFFIISCIGFINTNKQPLLQINVIKKLIDDGYPINLVFAGKLPDELTDIKTEIKKSKYQDFIKFTDYLNEKEYYTAISASDIIINLRVPSMGEASLTCLHSLTAGKAVILSDNNQYKEFPDNVAWKLPLINSDEYLCNYLEVLLNKPNVLKKLQYNAREYSKLFSVDKICKEYYEVITD